MMVCVALIFSLQSHARHIWYITGYGCKWLKVYLFLLLFLKPVPAVKKFIYPFAGPAPSKNHLSCTCTARPRHYKTTKLLTIWRDEITAPEALNIVLLSLFFSNPFEVRRKGMRVSRRTQLKWIAVNVF